MKPMVVGLTIALLAGCSGGSPEYQVYEEASELLGVDTFDEDRAQLVADANCPGLSAGREPAQRFNDQDHLNRMAALYAGYCPSNIEWFLHRVTVGQPVWAQQASDINTALYPYK